MRKIFGGILAGLLMLGFFSLALAQKNKAVPEKEAMKCDMMGKGMMGDMRMMNPMMMANNNLVATSDGGVIVLVGNKLQKYDKDLVLKKEVEINMEGTPKNMQMKGKSPMSEQMMQEEKGKTKE